MPYPHSCICCHFSYNSVSCGQVTKVWAKVFGPFFPLGIFCICAKPVFHTEYPQRSVKCTRTGAKCFNFYPSCILKWVICRVKNSETIFPGKILIAIVSSSLNVSITPPEVLNLPVHLLSVPIFLGALKLEAVFRKQVGMLANTCMWTMCCYFF